MSRIVRAIKKQQQYALRLFHVKPEPKKIQFGHLNKKEFYEKVVGVNYNELAKVGDGFIKSDATKTSSKQKVIAPLIPTEFKPKKVIAYERLLDHLEKLNETSYFEIFSKFLIKIYFVPWLFAILFLWIINNDDTDIEVPIFTNLATMIQLKIETERMEQIKINFESLRPKSWFAIQTERENQEKNVFNDAIVFETANSFYHELYFSETLFGLFFAKNIWQFRRIGMPGIIRSITLATKSTLHHKSLFSSLVMAFSCFLWIISVTCYYTSYVMEPSFRSIAMFESNPFYRFLIHAYGAKGVAMVRIIKGSEDSELNDLAHKMLHFHQDDILPYIKFHLSFQTAENTFDAEKCFMHSPENLEKLLRKGTFKFRNSADIFMDLVDLEGGNRVNILDLDAMGKHKIEKKRTIPVKVTDSEQYEVNTKEKEYWQKLSFLLLENHNLRSNMMDMHETIFSTSVTDKSKLWSYERLLAAFLFPAVIGMSYEEANGVDRDLKCECVARDSSYSSLLCYHLLQHLMEIAKTNK